MQAAIAPHKKPSTVVRGFCLFVVEVDDMVREQEMGILEVQVDTRLHAKRHVKPLHQEVRITEELSVNRGYVWRRGRWLYHPYAPKKLCIHIYFSILRIYNIFFIPMSNMTIFSRRVDSSIDESYLCKVKFIR